VVNSMKYVTALLISANTLATVWVCFWLDAFYPLSFWI